MQKLRTHFQNCYGIKFLEEEFDFTTKHAALIYAPNGIMKTSFAQTFKDHGTGKDSEDRVYPDRKTIREITDEQGKPLPAESVFVIDPFEGSYESKRVSTLLANSELKAEYDGILKNIDKKCASLIGEIKKTSGVKKGLEDIFSTAFTKVPDNLLRAFDRIKGEVYGDEYDPALADIKYNSIFSERIENLLSDEDVKSTLNEYTTTYDALLSKSRFFRKGVFNHYQAGEIARQLKNHGFFQADHKIQLTSNEGEMKVESEEELEKIIGEELENILSNKQLKSSFDKIDKKLTNNELRVFRDFLLEHQTLIPRLQTLEALRDDLLKSYLIFHRTSFAELMDEYEIGKKRIDEITKQASEQVTKWQDVINIFNRRFSVPFKVGIENKQDVILKRVTPNVSFAFEDEAAVSKEVERNELLELLSSGERRALYILNIIFEVEARISEGIPTVFVIDDIADSFDYKNKYAIVEYLADILSEDKFRQIILTHNYDFYRTVWHRLNLSGANFHVSRSSEGIGLMAETMYRDPFQKWRKRTMADGDNTAGFVAMIPFVRNLADYCGYRDEFRTLTNVLHVKPGRDPVRLSELEQIFKMVLNGCEVHIDKDGKTKVLSLIEETADLVVLQKESALDLEKKVVLSMGIRLAAERIMIELIDDDDLVKNISKNQTAELTSLFKKKFQDQDEHVSLLALMDRVNLMTPENIHLNSFMFEPILDMTSEHLCKLYKDVRNAGSFIKVT